MKIKVINELLLIIILTALVGATVLFSPNSILRLVLGLPVLLLFPGYALLAALFPARNALGCIEWTAFSLAVSVAVVSLIGIMLNYTSWGITLQSTLIANVIFIIVTSGVAWCRRYNVNISERGTVQFNMKLPLGKSQNVADRVISGILALAVLGAVVTAVYAYASPPVGEKFTEFYILRPEGQASDYTRELVVGQGGSVIIGIINREHELASYRVIVEIDGRENSRLGPVTLADGEKWEEEINYVPDGAGDNQNLEFYLYKNERAQPYLKPLRLWINVRPPE